MQTLHRFPERPDPLLTIVVPCFEEEETIPEFHQRITRVVKRLSVSCEILYVDDGSKDRTADILRHYQDGSSVRYLSLSRNFGKEAALSAGIDHARGSALIFIDVDLQDPPELIAAMVDYWQRGYDVVNMQRNLRIGDSWFKRMSARAYYWVMHRLVEKVDMPTDVSDFRLIGPAPLAALRALDERSRILKGMIGWVGFRTIELPTIVLFAMPEAPSGMQLACSIWPSRVSSASLANRCASSASSVSDFSSPASATCLRRSWLAVSTSITCSSEWLHSCASVSPWWGSTLA